MKNKASLALMEQLIMITVFAIAAALCLQIFAFSGRMSRELETRDHAVAAVQNAAESIKIANGDFSVHTVQFGGTPGKDTWEIGYNESWEITDSDDAVYTVAAHKTDSTAELLGTADVWACDRNGEIIFKVTVAWQEVLP